MSSEMLATVTLASLLLTMAVASVLSKRKIQAKIDLILGDEPLENLSDSQLVELVESLPLGHPVSRAALRLLLERNRRFKDELWERIRYSTNLS